MHDKYRGVLSAKCGLRSSCHTALITWDGTSGIRLKTFDVNYAKIHH